MEYFKSRLYEASTWRGLVFILAACLIKVFPQMKEDIIVGAFGFAGAIGLLFKDTMAPLIPVIPNSLEEIKNSATSTGEQK